MAQSNRLQRAERRLGAAQALVRDLEQAVEDERTLASREASTTDLGDEAGPVEVERPQHARQLAGTARFLPHNRR
jgi:hypothetical protein